MSSERLNVVPSAPDGRSLKTLTLDCDLCVVGGGLAGVCAAVAAAREGRDVVLVHDRPVLGGNSSSEVRLWVLGATAHMGSVNRWAREGGICGELMEENLWRNRDGNPLIWDALLLETVTREPTLKLLLNTSCHGCSLDAPGRIGEALAYCAQNETCYRVRGRHYVDASGDGVLAFAAGAAFRQGAESKEEFGESFAPDERFGHLLGQSIYFYSKDVGHKVPFTAPSFALQDITEIPRWRRFNAKNHGCHLWWIEYGGRLDPVHDTEQVKWELWKVVYGVWNHIKNSGEFPEAENLTLEWVGQIPGKRESRRFEGLHMLTQHDVVERTEHPDVVAHGGWSIDLHPADGVYSSFAGSAHLYPKGVYGIPFRCYVPQDFENLMVGGRIISASHVAFGSTRVMGTGGLGGQAVGTAAALCLEQGLTPAELAGSSDAIRILQQRLLANGQYVPGHRYADDLTASAVVSASSTFQLDRLPGSDNWTGLEQGFAQLIPFGGGPLPAATFTVRVTEPATLRVRWRVAERAHEFAPERDLHEQSMPLDSGTHTLTFDPGQVRHDTACYLFLTLEGDGVELQLSDRRVTGILSVRQRGDRQHAGSGGHDFENWSVERRPGGHNMALVLDPPVETHAAENVLNGIDRPTDGTNAWSAAADDSAPALTVTWDRARTLSQVDLVFDSDWDHAMESAQWGHPERAVPFCPPAWRLEDDAGRLLHEEQEWHRSLARVRFDDPVTTTALRIVLTARGESCPASLFSLRAYVSSK